MRKSKKITLNELFEGYESNLKKSALVEICKDFNKLVINAMIYEGFIFSLPYQLGTLSIRKNKTNPNRKRLNFNLTKKYNKKIYHDNRHSDGFYGKFHWSKNGLKSKFKYKSYYSFRPSKANKKELVNAITNENTIYKYQG